MLDINEYIFFINFFFFKKGFYLHNFTCLFMQCPKGFAGNNRTSTCDTSCEKSNLVYLNSSDNICKICTKFYYYLNNTCLNKCPIPLWGHLNEVACSNMCKGEGLFVDFDQRLCKPCHPSCKTCSGPLSTDCKTCPNGLSYFLGSCNLNCKSNYYSDGNTTVANCKKCPDGCFSCWKNFTANSIICTSCDEMKFLKNSFCVSECGKGFFNDFV